MLLISVLLPVYNSEKYIFDAIQSILTQSLEDFELIVLDDCSRDNSLNIIGSFKDERIKILKSDSNQGYVFQLNKGLSISRGKYIARMDSDDIAIQERFQLQYEFLESNSDYVLCGTGITIFFDADSSKQQFDNFVLTGNDETIRIELLYRNPICHPSVMIRKDVLTKNNLQYKQEYITAEDYKMWCDLSKYGKINNLAQPLLNYRIQPNQVTQKHSGLQQATVNRIREEYREFFLRECIVNPLFKSSFNFLLEQYKIASNKTYDHSFNDGNFFTKIKRKMRNWK